MLALLVPVLFHGVYDFAIFLETKILQDLTAGAAVTPVKIITVIPCLLLRWATFAHIIATKIRAAGEVKSIRIK